MLTNLMMPHTLLCSWLTMVQVRDALHVWSLLMQQLLQRRIMWTSIIPTCKSTLLPMQMRPRLTLLLSHIALTHHWTVILHQPTHSRHTLCPLSLSKPHLPPLMGCNIPSHPIIITNATCTACAPRCYHPPTYGCLVAQTEGRWQCCLECSSYDIWSWSSTYWVRNHREAMASTSVCCHGRWIFRSSRE
jgi:hypothetical protein